MTTIRPRKPTGTAIETDAGRRLGIIRRGIAGTIPGTTIHGTTGVILGTTAAGMVDGTTRGTATAGIRLGAMAIEAIIMAIVMVGMVEAATIAVPAVAHGVGPVCRTIRICRVFAAVRAARIITRWAVIAAAPILTPHVPLTAHPTPVLAVHVPADGRVAVAPSEAVAVLAEAVAAPWVVVTHTEAEGNLLL